MTVEGEVNLRNPETGQTIPYMIGTAGNGMPTNQVRIIYDKNSGDVVTMFPVPR